MLTALLAVMPEARYVLTRTPARGQRGGLHKRSGHRVVAPSFTVSRSKIVEPDSAVSMCSQYVSVAVVQPAVTVTDWASVTAV